MPVFEKVQQLLDSFAVANVPGTVDPGSALSPSLTPGVDSVYALVGDVELAWILSSLRPNADLNAPSIQAILKEVEFQKPGTLPYVEPTAADLKTNEQTVGPLPYTIPQAGAPIVLAIGQAIQGAIAKGSVNNAALITFLRALLANIDLRIVQRVLDVAPTVKVVWQVLDGAGQEIAAIEISYDQNGVPTVLQRPGTAFLTAITQTNLPIFVPLPAFVDYTGTEPTPLDRYLACTISIDLTGSPGGTVLQRRIGPIPFKIPLIPIPRALVVTEHVDFQGRAFIVVPSWSVINGPADLLAPVSRVQSVLATLTQTATVLNLVLPVDLGPVVGILAVLAALARAPVVLVYKTNKWNAEFVWTSGLWPLSGMSLGVFPFSVHWWWPWPSAMALTGAPGATVSAFVGDYFERRWGALTLSVGRWPAAVVTSLVGGAPGALPAGSSCNVDTAASNGDFNDSVKSFSF
jgi:hypothetical protein